MVVGPAGKEHGMRDRTAAGNGSAPQPGRAQPAPPVGCEGTFCVDDLAALRRLAAEQARRAGLAPGRLSDFVLAVNEVATNAVRHGCDRARLRLWVAGDDLCCEVRGGRWISAQRPAAVPDDADSLRLWVVWQVCRDVTLSYGPNETTVLLSMGIR